MNVNRLLMMLAAALCALPLFAKIELATPFADRMVLQRDRDVPVWGNAAPGKQVGDSVEFGGLLGSAPIMPVHTESSADFIARGGRIPAPLHSLKN